MIDPYRATRQFERFIGKTYEELMHPQQRMPSQDKSGCKLIARIIYTEHRDEDGKLIDITSKVERVNDKLLPK